LDGWTLEVEGGFNNYTFLSQWHTSRCPLVCTRRGKYYKSFLIKPAKEAPPYIHCQIFINYYFYCQSGFLKNKNKKLFNTQVPNLNLERQKKKNYGKLKIFHHAKI
jgi:hypothetical protein